MQLLLPILYSAIFIFLICKMKFFEIPAVSRTRLVLLFVLKLVAGSAVWLVYTYHYPAASDFNNYFSDSKILVQNLFNGTNLPYSSAWNGNFENVLFSNSRAVIILNALLQLFSFGNFYVHSVFFCFFSYVGLIALLKAFLPHFPSKEKRILLALFFIPSVLFWGSAALKESLIIGLAGLLIYVSDFGLRKKYNVKQTVAFILLFVILFLMKIYIALALLPVLLVNFIVSRTTEKRLAVKYAIVIVANGSCFFLVAKINDDYNVLKIIADKQAKAISEARGGAFLVSDKHFVSVDFYGQDTILSMQPDSSSRINHGANYLMWNLENMKDTIFVNNSDNDEVYHLIYGIRPANSVLAIRKLKPEWIDFAAYSPVAFVNTLAHPSFFEVRSWLHLMIALENIWVMIFIVLAVLFFDKNIWQKKTIFFFCLFFVLILYVLIGITTPAIGAMVRYRTIAELLLVIMCLLAIDEEKLRKRFSKKQG